VAAVTGKPLLLIDVDGVVNLGQFMSSAQRKRLRRSEGWYSGRAGDPRDRYAERIVLNRRWGPMLRSLEDEGAELAWATAWNEAANWWISPLLRLGELPVALAMDGSKAETVVPWTRGRPWAWLEDREFELEDASALAGDVPHLPVLVDPQEGLGDEHVERVREWIVSLRD
jgi:hypothetical protein